MDQGNEGKLSEDLKAELDRRLADDDAAPEDVVAWEEVKAHALGRVRVAGRERTIVKANEEGFEVSTITGLMTVDEYEAKVASGEIPEDSRVELIEGRLVRKVTKNPPHTYSIYAVRDAISALMPPGWHVRQESPVRVPPLSEPEPDISVVRGTAKTYKKRHPGPVEIALIVEVADSSLADDRVLAVTYGAAGIPVYWIVNLRDRQLEVYTDPDLAGGYRSRVDYQPGQDVPVVIDGQEVGRIAVADLLP